MVNHGAGISAIVTSSQHSVRASEVIWTGCFFHSVCSPLNKMDVVSKTCFAKCSEVYLCQHRSQQVCCGEEGLIVVLCRISLVTVLCPLEANNTSGNWQRGLGCILCRITEPQHFLSRKGPVRIIRAKSCLLTEQPVWNSHTCSFFCPPRAFSSSLDPMTVQSREPKPCCSPADVPDALLHSQPGVTARLCSFCCYPQQNLHEKQTWGTEPGSKRTRFRHIHNDEQIYHRKTPQATKRKGTSPLRQT